MKNCGRIENSLINSTPVMGNEHQNGNDDSGSPKNEIETITNQFATLK